MEQDMSCLPQVGFSMWDRLKNISISWEAPIQWIQTVPVRSPSIQLSGDNLRREFSSLATARNIAFCVLPPRVWFNPDRRDGWTWHLKKQWLARKTAMREVQTSSVCASRSIRTVPD